MQENKQFEKEKAQYNSPVRRRHVSLKPNNSEPRSQRDYHHSQQRVRERLSFDRKLQGKSKTRSFLGKRTNREDEEELRLYKRSKLSTPIARVHYKRFDYMEVEEDTRDHDQRVQKYKTDVEHYESTRKGMGAIAPNQFSSKIDIGLAEFLREGAGGAVGFDREATELKCTDVRFSMVLKINANAKTITIQIEPRSKYKKNFRRQRFVIPFHTVSIHVSSQDINRNVPTKKWTFHLYLTTPAIPEVHVKGLEWKVTSSDILGDPALRRSPQIIIESTIEKSKEFANWWKELILFYPSFKNVARPMQYDHVAVQKLFDARLNETTAVDTTGLITEGTATRCRLSLFDLNLETAVEEQALEVVIPRFWSSVEKPLLRSYMQMCPCKEVVFINEHGRIVTWLDGKSIHETCTEACWYRLGRRR